MATEERQLAVFHKKFSQQKFEAGRNKIEQEIKEWRITKLKIKRKQQIERSRALSIKYQAALIRATPIWVDKEKIKDVYRKCRWMTRQTGHKHHVDHYYPLQGKTVSGLHVHNNLNIIPADTNARKNNHHPEE